MTKVAVPEDCFLEFRTPDTNELVVRFNHDGTLDIGPGFSPDEAGMRAAEVMAEFLAKFARAEAMAGYPEPESDPTIQ